MSEAEKRELQELISLLYGNNISQHGKRCLVQYIDKLQKENQELKEENEKINKVADKMYEYISYYGWEDFESNTGRNREEMVDYFYKE